MKKGIKRVVTVVLVSLLVVVVSGCSKGEEEDTQVKVNYEVSDLVGENYKDVETNLKNNGFENIELKKEEDLITGWLTKDGEVESVAIDGNEEFVKEDKFDKDVAVQVVYHTFAEKQGSTENTSNIEENFLDIDKEIQADENNKVEITGKTLPGATVSEGMGIIGDKTTADDDGNFKLEKELSIPEKTTVTINSNLDGQKASLEVVIIPNESAVKKYEEKQAQQSSEQAAKEAEEKAKEEEATKIITVDNTPDFKELMLHNDDYFQSAIDFSEKYYGRTIEFDGNFTDVMRYDEYDYINMYDLLITYGDYSADGSGLTGPYLKASKVKPESSFDMNRFDVVTGTSVHVVATVSDSSPDGSYILINPKSITVR